MNNSKEHSINTDVILSDIDQTTDKRYLKRICELYYNEGVSIEQLRSVFNERCAVCQYLTNDNVDGKDITTLCLENDKGTFRKRWYYYAEAFQSWKSTIIYEDEYTTINKPHSFIESREIGNQQWCFCHKEDKWIQHNQDFMETIYFVHCIIQPNIWQYNAVCVLPNGGMKIIDSNHNYLSRNGEIGGYLHSLGNEAMSKLISDKNTNETKTIKDMKQNKKTINEAQLRAIVKEAVRNVLNEDYRDTHQVMTKFALVINKVSKILSNFANSIPQEVGDDFMKKCGSDWNGLWESLTGLQEIVINYTNSKGVSQGYQHSDQGLVP